ncbi:tetratricopeptide repeat protein [Elizabethkingia ursingii]|uniref:LuxR C-terminal-related transcriptional regulator n=1 Tax=Elizabethkingia ursingii TaxID=1756150 RepID=UPI002011882B|nr:LuxR C-terminal-related transcriptional regulator [Elizabethkingia ursingii]MCL1668176.1 tetratricopeptide repeat protein [Elizabethkingia ursingii]
MLGVPVSFFKGWVLVLIILLLNSCKKLSQDERNKMFDIPLMKQNEEIRLSGDYKKLFALNVKYYNLARKEHYKEGEALCYINLAYVNTTVGNYKQALLLLKRSENILANSDNNEHKSKLYGGFSELSYILGLYHNALNYNKQALNLLEKDNAHGEKKAQFTLLYRKRGRILYETEQYDSALFYFHKSRSMDKAQPLGEIWIATVHMKKNQLDSAKVYVESALNKLRDQNNIATVRRNEIYFKVGNYYAQINHYKEAESYYLKALEINSRTKEIFGSFFTARMCKALADLYKKTGESGKEKQYKDCYYAEKDKLYNAQKEAINIATAEFINNVKKREDKAEVKVWLYIAILSIVIVGVGGYSYLKIRSLRLKKQSLHTQRTKLTEHMSRNLFNETVELAKAHDPEFLIRFQELNPEFIQKLKILNPSLETSEISFCAMIRLNFTSKEIANCMDIQHASVQQRKRRIRKKLNIPSDVDLYQFFCDL